jgi:Zn-dependent protease with chaperone function
MALPGRLDPQEFDFFAQQDLARRNTRRLLLWFALAAIGVVASYCLLVALLYGLLGLYAGRHPGYFSAVAATPPSLMLVIAGAVLATILLASAQRAWRMRHGGYYVAELLGARLLEAPQTNAAERRLLNVVEEMAIASGIAVPPVHVMHFEDAVNALVAGYTPNEAVIVVTKGALQKLSRDELQGVMGHEFSHILNGDMALNLRLSCILAGLSWLGEQGEAMVWRAAAHDRRRAREQRTGGFEALVGALLAFVGHPGVLAADAIKAAISREREFLADAASVQFTRNPDGIAGALDTIVAGRSHTSVRAAHAHELSHMFFAPVAGRWWSFPTHPPIEARIRRAHPRFLREDYRERRHGTRAQVAVIDGAGNVVKHLASGGGLVGATVLAAAASVGRPRQQHVDHARRLLGALPAPLRDALHLAADAELALFALALGPELSGAGEALPVLQSRRGPDALARTRVLHASAAGVARSHMLTLAELAIPAIKGQPQAARDQFVADMEALVQADRRVTLSEFVLATFLRQRLREGAGDPIRTEFRRVEQVSADAHAVLSLVALGSGGDVGAAYARGRGILDCLPPAPLPREQLSTVRVGEALERLRRLAPLAKPAVLKACFEAAAADGVYRLAEVELVRTVAATLDCPVPPLIAAQDPQALAA